MSDGLINSRRFSAQVAWTLATRLLMIVNSVAAGIIVAHWLGAQGVGELAVINVAVTTIVQLGSFGLPSSNTYFIAKDRAHGREERPRQDRPVQGSDVAHALLLHSLKQARELLAERAH